jgi:hypothetical protein
MNAASLSGRHDKRDRRTRKQVEQLDHQIVEPLQAIFANPSPTSSIG